MKKFEKLLECSDGIIVANKNLDLEIEAQLVRQSQHYMIEKANLNDKIVMTTCDNVISIMDGSNYIMVQECRPGINQKIEKVLEQIRCLVNCCLKTERLVDIKV